MPELCEYCLPFVRPGGYFIAMKGDSADEVNQARKAIHLLSGKLEEIKEFTLPGTDYEAQFNRDSKNRIDASSLSQKSGKTTCFTTALASFDKLFMI
jgi:16S rRNA (guanine527-N7)-methyltransferase